MAQRLWEVDVTRGVAVVLMVVFHFFFDLNYLGLARFDFSSGFFVIFQRIIAFLFLSLVGVSLVLSRLRGVDLHTHAKRVAGLGAIALFVTFATWVFPRDGFIIFGILHFITLAVLLGWFLTRLPSWMNLAAGLGVLAAGFWLSSLPPIQSPWLLWLGFAPAGFYTLDYYPLIPWFGIVLFGVFMGQTMDLFRRPFSDRKMPQLMHGLNFLGRNALAVYLIHQPVLFGLLLSVKYVFGL